MAGLDLISSFAVSVQVVAAAPALPVQQPWQSAANENFSAVVEKWSAQAGMSQVEIAPELGALAVGGVQVKAQDICAAVGRLVASLRYAAAPPRLAQCDAHAGVLRVTADPIVASLSR